MKLNPLQYQQVLLEQYFHAESHEAKVMAKTCLQIVLGLIGISILEHPDPYYKDTLCIIIYDEEVFSLVGQSSIKHEFRKVSRALLHHCSFIGVKPNKEHDKIYVDKDRFDFDYSRTGQISDDFTTKAA